MDAAAGQQQAGMVTPAQALAAMETFSTPDADSKLLKDIHLMVCTCVPKVREASQFCMHFLTHPSSSMVRLDPRPSLIQASGPIYLHQRGPCKNFTLCCAIKSRRNV